MSIFPDFFTNRFNKKMMVEIITRSFKNFLFIHHISLKTIVMALTEVTKILNMSMSKIFWVSMFKQLPIKQFSDMQSHWNLFERIFWNILLLTLSKHYNVMEVRNLFRIMYSQKNMKIWQLFVSNNVRFPTVLIW